MSTDITKAPECQLRGFLACYGKLIRSGCCRLFISVQPFRAKECSYMSTDITKAPECQLRGFLACYGKLIRSGCCRLFISVQPFANVVASYTCQHRDKECNYVFHGHHLLSAGGSAASTSYHIFCHNST